MRAPYRVRHFFAEVLQHYRVGVIARDASAAAYKYYKAKGDQHQPPNSEQSS